MGMRVNKSRGGAVADKRDTTRNRLKKPYCTTRHNGTDGRLASLKRRRRNLKTPWPRHRPGVKSRCIHPFTVTAVRDLYSKDSYIDVRYRSHSILVPN